MDEAGAFRKDIIQQFFEMGLMGIEIPEEYGGQGGSFFQAVLAVEEPETNLVFFDTRGTGLTADVLAERVRQVGISVSTVGPYRVRACTHLDVDAEGIAQAVKAIAEAVR